MHVLCAPPLLEQRAAGHNPSGKFCTHTLLAGEEGKGRGAPQLPVLRACFGDRDSRGRGKVVGVLCKKDGERRGSEGGTVKRRTSALTLFAIDSRYPSAPTDDQDNRRRKGDNQQPQHHVCCGSILAGPRRVRLRPLGLRATAAAASTTAVVVEGPNRTHGRLRRGAAVVDDATAALALL